MSQAPSGYERIPADKYYTPTWVTDAIIRKVNFFGDGLDPCAGAGHMMEPFFEIDGVKMRGIDIEPEQAWIEKRDFLAKPVQPMDFVIANPPYGVQGRLAMMFIRSALATTKPRKGRVAMLLRVDFDSGKTRRNVFADHPAFFAKYPLTKRIHWVNVPVSLNANGKPVQPTDNHAWYVWRWDKSENEDVKYGYLP